MENPIKNNRIVNDITFARRFKSFLKDVQPGCAMGEEELEYLQNVADKLLAYQIDTCPEKEKSYHLNCDKTIEFKVIEDTETLSNRKWMEDWMNAIKKAPFTPLEKDEDEWTEIKGVGKFKNLRIQSIDTISDSEITMNINYEKVRNIKFNIQDE